MTYIPDALRQKIQQQAKNRCEYCRLHEIDAYHSHEIDHIFAEKHGGETAEANLCLACFVCNRHKGSDLCSIDPQTGNVTTLYHPRRDTWTEHFRLMQTGIIEPLTATGRVPARVLRFNRLDLVDDRRSYCRAQSLNM